MSVTNSFFHGGWLGGFWATKVRLNSRKTQKTDGGVTARFAFSVDVLLCISALTEENISRTVSNYCPIRCHVYAALGEEADVSLQQVAVSDGGLRGGEVPPRLQQEALHQRQVRREAGQRALRGAADRLLHRLREHVVTRLQSRSREFFSENTKMVCAGWFDEMTTRQFPCFPFAMRCEILPKLILSFRVFVRTWSRRIPSCMSCVWSQRTQRTLALSSALLCVNSRPHVLHLQEQMLLSESVLCVCVCVCVCVWCCCYCCCCCVHIFKV